MDFLNYILNRGNKETILINLDVFCLSTNTPYTLGPESVEFWKRKHPQGILERFYKELMIERLHLVLENNYF